MVLDVKDPLVADRILSQPPMPTCDMGGSGWYGNVAWGLARAILRQKIAYMVDNSAPYPYEEDLMPLFELPSHIGPDEDVGKISVTDNPRCVQVCSDIRGPLRGPPVVRKPREKRDDGADASPSAGDQGRKRVRWQDEEGEGELGAEFDDDLPEIEEEDEEQEPELVPEELPYGV
jgi:hypothetical protein